MAGKREEGEEGKRRRKKETSIFQNISLILLFF